MCTNLIVCLFVSLFIGVTHSISCYVCSSSDGGCGASVDTSKHTLVACADDQVCRISSIGDWSFTRRCSESCFLNSRAVCCGTDGCNRDLETARTIPKNALQCYQCAEWNFNCEGGDLLPCLKGETYCKTELRDGSITKTCSDDCTPQEYDGIISYKTSCCETNGCNQGKIELTKEALKCYQCSSNESPDCGKDSSPCLDGETYCQTLSGQFGVVKKCSHSCEDASASDGKQEVKNTCCKTDGCNAPDAAQGLRFCVLVVMGTVVTGYLFML